VQSPTPENLLEQAFGRSPIAAITRALDAFDGDVHLVGGSVRDLFLGRELVDVDLAVDGDAGSLAAALGAPLGAETRFGTISVVLGGYRYDIVRTRSESYEHPGALPSVEPAGIEADLARRDFTVNALALGLAGAGARKLITAPGALEDLRTRRLAVLHDRSFIDDPTRLFRLGRYAARLGFEPAPHTRELAAAAIADAALETISGTRIGNELRLLATEPDPIAAFEAVHGLGLPWAIDREAARRGLAALPADGRADLLVLACVLAPEHLDDLGLSAGERDAIAEAAGKAGELARRLARADSRSQIARAVGTSGPETVALASGQGAASQARTWLRELRHMRLAITGDDLIASGLEQGPRLGQALQAARDAMLDGRAPDRESQLAAALRAAE
jgi:tRNA nucleotidyltransferase (CCA-adding enzyme)